MKRLFFLLSVLFFCGTSAAQVSAPPLSLQDKTGPLLRPIYTIQCVGDGISCEKVGTKGVLTVSGSVAAHESEYNHSNFETAYGWGNHASAGYAPLVSPSFTTPSLGAASATSVNKVAITAPATNATLTIADGKTLTATNTVNLNTMTDGKWCKYSSSGTALDCNVDPVVDTNTTYTAGRSLTLDGTTINADAELYTDNIFTFNLENPVTGDDGDFGHPGVAVAFTVTKVICNTDTGTATINIEERVSTTPNTAGTDILSTDLVCDSNRQSSCASGCDVNTITNARIDAEDVLALMISAVANSPTKLRVTLIGTKDD